MEYTHYFFCFRIVYVLWGFYFWDYNLSVVSSWIPTRIPVCGVVISLIPWIKSCVWISTTNGAAVISLLLTWKLDSNHGSGTVWISPSNSQLLTGQEICGDWDQLSGVAVNPELPSMVISTMEGDCTRMLLITANVGSLFEEVRMWLVHLWI